MDISAEKVIEQYAQELANVQQLLFIARAALAQYEAASDAEAAKPVD